MKTRSQQFLNVFLFLDSEDVSTVSPGSTASLSSFSSLSPGYPEQREPLSLVVREQTSSTPTCSGGAKHWKKSVISRNYMGDHRTEDQENGPISPCTSTTVEALLSLGNSVPPLTSVQERVSSSRPVSGHRIVQPWTMTSSRHSSVSPVLFPSHPLPPIHFKSDPEPLRLLSLPQQPAPLREVSNSNLQLSSKPPVFPVIKQEPTNFWIQPSTGHSNNPLYTRNFSCENVKEPVAAVTRDRPFECRDCKKSFSTQSGFAKHQQLHCSNQIQRETSCKHCGKVYNSNSALKMHIKTHTLPCKCDICGKAFSRPWLLQGHKRTHTGEKPFKCEECPRTFADKSNLRAHLQTHLQNKKYSCTGCQKTFSRMSLLTKHHDTGCLGLQRHSLEESSLLTTPGLLRS